MGSVSVDLLALDERTMAIEVLAKRVQLAVARGSLEVRLWMTLLRSRRALRTTRGCLDRAEVRSTEDRVLMSEVARGHTRFVATLERGRDRLTEDGGTRPTMFRRLSLRLMDGLVDEAGDIAETAALSASAEFARLVERDLDAHFAAGTRG